LHGRAGRCNSHLLAAPHSLEINPDELLNPEVKSKALAASGPENPEDDEPSSSLSLKLSMAIRNASRGYFNAIPKRKA
jgi:hypothetical protein